MLAQEAYFGLLSSCFLLSGLLLTCCLILGKLFFTSMPEFTCLNNGNFYLILPKISVFYIILTTFSLWIKQTEFWNFSLQFSHSAPTNCCGKSDSSSLSFCCFHTSHFLSKKASGFMFIPTQLWVLLGPLGLLRQSNSSTARLILLEKLHLSWLAPLRS